MPGGALACSVAELRAPGAPALDRTGDAHACAMCRPRAWASQRHLHARLAFSGVAHPTSLLSFSFSRSHSTHPRFHATPTVAEKRQTFCLGLSSERNRLGRIAIGCGHSCHGHYCRACDGAQDKIVPGRLPCEYLVRPYPEGPVATSDIRSAKILTGSRRPPGHRTPVRAVGRPCACGCARAPRTPDTTVLRSLKITVCTDYTVHRWAHDRT